MTETKVLPLSAHKKIAQPEGQGAPIKTLESFVKDYEAKNGVDWVLPVRPIWGYFPHCIAPGCKTSLQVTEAMFGRAVAAVLAMRYGRVDREMFFSAYKRMALRKPEAAVENLWSVGILDGLLAPPMWMFHIQKNYRRLGEIQPFRGESLLPSNGEPDEPGKNVMRFSLDASKYFRKGWILLVPAWLYRLSGEYGALVWTMLATAVGAPITANATAVLESFAFTRADTVRNAVFGNLPADKAKRSLFNMLTGKYRYANEWLSWAFVGKERVHYRITEEPCVACGESDCVILPRGAHSVIYEIFRSWYKMPHEVVIAMRHALSPKEEYHGKPTE